jgi:GDP-4-dehydro-6-deoxy-D-mannose reductase
MRIFITGAGGFVAAHLAAQLRADGDEGFGFLLPGERLPEGLAGAAGDLTAGDGALGGAIRAFAPEGCIHLAGISSVPAARADPVRAARVNIEGTLRLLDAMRAQAPSARTLVVSTAHVYGSPPPDRHLDEDAPLRPETMYAATKAAADALALQVARDRGQAVMVARPVNHIGPGQSPDFVVASFVRQLCAASPGGGRVRLQVGNLDSVRDFLDVRDVTRAYRLLLERGRPGLAYNIAGGERLRIGALLDRLCARAGVEAEITQDPDRMRPADASPCLATRRLREATGWAPVLPLDRTLDDMLARGRGKSGLPPLS